MRYLSHLGIVLCDSKMDEWKEEKNRFLLAGALLPLSMHGNVLGEKTFSMKIILECNGKAREREWDQA